MTDLIFISTFTNSLFIGELLNSFNYNNYLQLHVVLVAQNGVDIDIDPFLSEYTKIEIVKIPNQVNSSAARNIGIDYVFKNRIVSNFVMFPDDDSSFDDSFFRNFAKLTNPDFCYLTDVYETDTKEYFQHIIIKTGRRIDKYYWNSVGAVNIVLSYEMFCKVGRFDELMGVAAKYGGGEDGDIFIRSFAQGAIFQYVESLYSYHPSGKNKYKYLTYKQLLRRFKAYGQGVVYLLYKHRMYGEIIKLISRGLGGSIISLIKLDFKMSYVYLYAFWQRLKTFVKLWMSLY